VNLLAQAPLGADAREFWRFVQVQQTVAAAAQSAIASQNQIEGMPKKPSRKQ
jgi:hypothetical protein